MTGGMPMKPPVGMPGTIEETEQPEHGQDQVVQFQQRNLLSNNPGNPDVTRLDTPGDS